MYTADTLSRTPIEGQNSTTENDVETYVDGVISSIPVSDQKQEEICKSTAEDAVMQSLVNTILNGWPEERSQCRKELIPFWNYRDELSVINGMVFKGTQVVIPDKMRSCILGKIHVGHLGMEKCKQRAREVVFWPCMNQDIVNMVKQCETCQANQKQQMAEPLLTHPLPMRPWQKVSTDLFELGRKDYIVIVDSYSNYPEVIGLSSQSSSSVILAMKTTFARHGIPEEVLSDNGPCYSSMEFAQFSKDWDFQHVTSSPKFPQSNRLAEKTVQTVNL
ncbi:uncharacterized protein K02A2.6-like [Gigantopelta aegis]|uniref:uncharacterized protein K02A2.6-like n=1 Tax=Gigantopelta aegis TaxID=1735272 RepID=UPI001B887778|nr:uncharacterized protein K02A2.6-like [Gigantopelta aegis]